jgi:quercetin dioxygenase-like cupin family protein
MLVKYHSVQEEAVAEGVMRKVLAYDGKLMSVEFKFAKGSVGAVHHHPHEQIGYVVKGSLELEMNGSKQVIEAGDTYYVEPNVPHGVIALEEAVVVDLFTPHRQDFIK